MDSVVAGRAGHEQRIGAGAAIDRVDAVTDGEDSLPPPACNTSLPPRPVTLSIAGTVDLNGGVGIALVASRWRHRQWLCLPVKPSVSPSPSAVAVDGEVAPPLVGALPTRRDHLPARWLPPTGSVSTTAVFAAVSVQRIGARIADERVVAAAAGENVVAGIAGDDVGVAVAGAVDVAAAGQGQVLDIGAERVADRRLHGVGALADEFRRQVAGIVDDVGIVADAAHHGVGAGATIEGVVAAVAGEDVGVTVAGAVEVGGPGQGEVVDIGAEREAHRRLHEVGAFAGIFGHHVADVVDQIGVVAGTPLHGVGARAAVEDIVAAAAGERVGGGCADEGVGAAEPLQGGDPRWRCRPAVGRSQIGGGREERAQIDRAADLVHVDDGPGLERRVRAGVHGPRDVHAVVGPGEAVETGDPVECNDVLAIGAGDRQIVDGDVAGLIERAHIGDVGAVLDAAHLDRLLRKGAGRVDDDIGDGQILVVSEQQDVGAAACRAARGRVVVELAVEDRHRTDRAAQRRDRAVAGTDIGEAVLLGVGDRDVVERHRAGKAGGIGRDRDAIVLAGGIDIEIGDRERADERAGNGDLAVEGDAIDAPVLDAVDGEGLAGDGHVFGVGAGRDLDSVAVSGCVDRGLDGGVAAVADEQDVVGAGAVDLLDAGERVGAFAATGGHREVTGAVVGDARGADRGGVGRGVDAAAADDRVVAATAGERVVAAAADDRVVAAETGKRVVTGIAGVAPGSGVSS